MSVEVFVIPEKYVAPDLTVPVAPANDPEVALGK